MEQHPLITLTDVDLDQPAHSQAVLQLTRAYACDPMGGGRDLPPDVQAELVPRLRQRPDYFGVIAWDDGQAVGLATCFEGFSTFQARPLMNVHDLCVAPTHRGRGLSHRLLARVEQAARERGCVKLTLEVLDGNTVAVASYRRFGFDTYALDPAYGRAQFWQKPL